MKKSNLWLLALGVVMTLPAKAQWNNGWNSWNTAAAISGVVGIANSAIQSAERKKQMELQAMQKAQFEQGFKDTMAEAKELEGFEQWEDALDKYEEAASLNCKYGYTDQLSLTQKINSLYIKAGRDADGPSILNNDKVTLADYSGYRYMKENPIFTNKKKAKTRIVRVACSDTETRIELEFESNSHNAGVSYTGNGYLKPNKGDKLESVGVENITVGGSFTYVPWPFQKLRFAIIFPPLPADATEFDFIVPKSTWMFKDIKCR